MRRELDEMTPGECLEEVRRECLAYVAEHFEPAPEGISDEKYVGSKHDPEHVWDEALAHAIGPVEWWERYAADVETLARSTEVEVERYLRTYGACAAIMQVALRASAELDHQERLFGKAAEFPEAYSPEWTTLVASGIDDKTPIGLVDLIVGNYLLNVRDRLMDATGALDLAEGDD